MCESVSSIVWHFPTVPPCTTRRQPRAHLELPCCTGKSQPTSWPSNSQAFCTQNLRRTSQIPTAGFAFFESPRQSAKLEVLSIISCRNNGHQLPSRIWLLRWAIKKSVYAIVLGLQWKLNFGGKTLFICLFFAFLNRSEIGFEQARLVWKLIPGIVLISLPILRPINGNVCIL